MSSAVSEDDDPPGVVVPLRGISEIRSFFRTNEAPVYFVSPTAFNLLGIDRWMRNIYYISYYDSFEGAHPRIFVPTKKPYQQFDSIEDVNNYLLRDPEVAAFIRSHGPGGKVAFVFFNEETERLAADLGLEMLHPPYALCHRLDSKIETTRLGNEAGAPSVPNVVVQVSSYETLVTVASDAGLGNDLVVQLAYGDSGKTTFFIASAADYTEHEQQMSNCDLKVMKRINNRAAAVEAVITRYGTIVGPFMTDLTGYPELTPYAGGWCGNDVYPTSLESRHQARARDLIGRLGDRLAVEGYRGFFEVDILVDLDTDEVYLGELNPRISGASPMTNVAAGAYADLPLFLFHVLEYMELPYELDVEALNERWARLAGQDGWSQIVMKETRSAVELITQAPRTGVWRLGHDGEITFVRTGYDWHSILGQGEAFFLRVYGPGDYLYRGADLGILLTRDRLQTDDKQLTDLCRHWIEALRAQYVSTPIEAAQAPAIRAAPRKSA
jgi:biotin carboxylase